MSNLKESTGAAALNNKSADPKSQNTPAKSKPPTISNESKEKKTHKDAQVANSAQLFQISNNAVQVAPGEYESLAPARLEDINSTVGISNDIEIGDITSLNMTNLHPCMFCNITLRKGVIILSIFEIVS